MHLQLLLAQDPECARLQRLLCRPWAGPLDLISVLDSLCIQLSDLLIDSLPSRVYLHISMMPQRSMSCWMHHDFRR